MLLNITPDHLDRHGNMQNYAAIKERLIAGSILAVVGIDDPPSRAVADRRVGDLVRIRVADTASDPGTLTAREGGTS